MKRSDMPRRFCKIRGRRGYWFEFGHAPTREGAEQNVSVIPARSTGGVYLPDWEDGEQFAKVGQIRLIDPATV